MGLLSFAGTGGGALAEYIVVDRTRVGSAPRPGRVEVPWLEDGQKSLTVEHIAALPLFGIPAHRVVETLPFTPGSGQRLVLVLGADTCVGSMVVQELSLREDLTVSAQFPKEWENLVEEGSDDILVGNPLTVMAGLHPAAYAMVVDCVGGHEVWSAAKRLLDPRSGQFTTIFGDNPESIPSRSAYSKSSMRSLRLAFVRSGGKSIGYEWITPVADGDYDVRTTLAAVGRMASEGAVFPPTLRSIVFERGMDAFKAEHGDCVVRIVN